MKKLMIFNKNIMFNNFCATMTVLLVALLFVPAIDINIDKNVNVYDVYMYGELVGRTNDTQHVERLMSKVRKELVKNETELYLVDSPGITFEGDSKIFARINTDKEFEAIFRDMFTKHKKNTMERGYMVKVNNESVYLKSSDDVYKLLYDTINHYDSEGKYDVKIEKNDKRVISVLTAQTVNKEEDDNSVDETVGAEDYMEEIVLKNDGSGEASFDGYELGLMSIGFPEEVEVVESYIPSAEIVSVDAAKEKLTAMQDVQRIYEVQAGDTLSQISIDLNVPMETIVELNKDYMEDVNSVIHVGQGLVITVPKPELSVVRTERAHYDETYEADVVYIDNNEWYTNQTVVKQEPSAGYREVIADITYNNDEEIGREVVKENVVMEAVPKIVERGTIVPPTYIKPISGGRMTSGFGKRKAPKRGASTYHKGVDWATAVGTPVYASSGGTVAKAGWGSGYGNVVYINHPDGRQTRYGHLSKILVSPGQTVKQGDKIALSGNTGVSTGPHIHFEILVNGSQVNPLNYLN